MKKICERCEKEFDAKAYQRFCSDCKLLHRKDYEKEYAISHGANSNSEEIRSAAKLIAKENKRKSKKAWRNGQYRDKKLNSMEKFLCEMCGKDLSYAIGNSEHYHEWVIHHLDWDHSNNDLNNLQLLCRKCHATAHSYDYLRSLALVTGANL